MYDSILCQVHGQALCRAENIKKISYLDINQTTAAI